MPYLMPRYELMRFSSAAVTVRLYEIASAIFPRMRSVPPVPLSLPPSNLAPVLKLVVHVWAPLDSPPFCLPVIVLPPERINEIVRDRPRGTPLLVVALQVPAT